MVGPSNTMVTKLGTVQSVNWISLPSNGDKSVETEFSTSMWVKPSSDYELIIDRNYSGGVHGEVKVIAKLKFYAGSVSQNTLISMSIDDETACITFSPAMVFNKVAELYVKFEGLNLSDVDPGNLDFLYLKDDGTVGQIEYKEIIFDQSSGILELKEGKIPHFSRFGFVK